MLYTPRDEGWRKKILADLPSLRALVAILPLLGLLGTIIGLLDVFHQMAVERGLDPTTLVSSGIADALFTTQVGLLTVVPGWLALTYLQAKTSESEPL
jgi:biopolymer transport protein ExbB